MKSVISGETTVQLALVGALLRKRPNVSRDRRRLSARSPDLKSLGAYAEAPLQPSAQGLPAIGVASLRDRRTRNRWALTQKRPYKIGASTCNPPA